MAEDGKNFWMKSGLAEFVNSENPGFKGSLKVLPEDFVVTELDSDGKKVVLNDYRTPEEKGCESLSLSSRKRKMKDNYTARTLKDDVTPLEELITSEQYKSLDDMANSYRKSAIPDPIHQLNLGPVEDKQKRAQLHSSVRLAFPVLITAVKRDEQKQPCIVVHYDPKYVKLLEALTPAEAEEMLVFTNIRSSSGSVLRLAPRPKDQRTEIHHLVNLLYGKSFVTHYVDDERSPNLDPSSASDDRESIPAKKQRLESCPDKPASQMGCIEVRVNKKRHHHFVRDGGEMRKEEVSDIFTKFVLRKRMVESSHALEIVSESVRCSLGDIKTQGRKDKHGITIQEASIKNVKPASLLSSRPKLLRCGIDVGNCKYIKGHVTIGGHFGNHFDITLKNLSCHGTEEERKKADLVDIVRKASESVKANGFVNYFGLQRLGQKSAHSGPRAGLALLKDDIKSAVDLLLTKDPNISEAVKDLMSKHQYRKVLEFLSEDMVLERLMIKSFIRFKGDSAAAYLKAIMSIPVESRSFFIQSFNSVLWNHVASYRIRQYGLKVVEGDLVIPGMNANWWDRPADATFDRLRTWVHCVSDEEAREKKYSVQEVVLPVMGSGVVLPKNKVGDKVTELLAMAGLSLASFRKTRVLMQHTGAYRLLLACPRNFSWSLKKNGPLASSHCEAVSVGTLSGDVCTHLTTDANGTECVQATSILPCTTREKGTTAETSHAGAGEYSKSVKADGPTLNLKFELGKNMFATMLVREIVRRDL